MKTTIVKETNTTPSIVLDGNTIIITGKSIPFEPELFWPLTIHQIKKYENVKEIKFELEYINTNSIPFIIKLINIGEFDINWSFDEDDEDMYELGENLKLLSKNTLNYHL